jgi:hypothetical protein
MNGQQARIVPLLSRITIRIDKMGWTSKGGLIRGACLSNPRRRMVFQLDSVYRTHNPCQCHEKAHRMAWTPGLRHSLPTTASG